MADHTQIEWTDATWNPITGCSVVSPGCTNCYAMKLAGTRLKHHPSRAGLTVDTKAGPVWNGKLRFNREWLTQPLRWKKPRMIFVCAHGDLFHEDVPDDWILDVLTIMAIASQHTFQVLTKRVDRMRDFMNQPDLLEDIYANWYGFDGGAVEVQSWPLHNVWLGASAEDQVRYDNRRRHLDETPAAVRFWSLEPMLGPIDMRIEHVRPGWVIVGGESGAGARPMHPDWVRSVRGQCAAAGVPFFFKQWGAWAPGQWTFDLDDRVCFEPDDPQIPVAGLADHDRAQHRVHWWDEDRLPEGIGSLNVGKRLAGRLLDGIEHNGMPEQKRVTAS